MALALCLTLLPATAQAAEGESSTEPHTHSNWLGSSQTSGKLQLLVGGSQDTGGTPQNTQENKFVLTGGNYYLKTSTEESFLDGDVKIKYPIVIQGNVTICLNGKTIQSEGEGMPVFIIENDATLTLTDCQNNKGKVTHASGVTGSGVKVESGGTFNMYGGKITGNKAETGGGVYVVDGTFTMNGGTISGNTANSTDGGVGVYTTATSTTATATFTMNGGTISGNTATNGGGVGVYGTGNAFATNGSAFIMNGGAISSNTANQGGGVYVSKSGTFEMHNSASVTGNTASASGGGVYVNSGTFNMNGSASIKNNNAAAKSYGGGVFVKSGGTFNMNGGAISENTANQGGGVYASGGTFNMNGSASITSNTVNGVYVHNNATFTVSGSPTVTGNKNASDAASNVFLAGSKTITIGGELTGSPNSIGVTRGA